MRHALIISLLLLFSAPAMAIYKCEAGGKTTYSDEWCPGGKTVDVTPQGLGDTSTAPISRSLAAQKGNAVRHPGRAALKRREIAERKVQRASTRMAYNKAHPEQTSSGK